MITGRKISDIERILRHFRGYAPYIYGLDDDIRYYYNLLIFLESGISDIEEKTKGRIQERKIEIQEEISDEEFYYEYEAKWNYRSLILNSVYTSIHSLFESRLNFLCEVLSKKIVVANTYNVENNNYKIKKCKNFLENESKLNLKYWNEKASYLDDFKKVRDVLTHGHGFVKKSNLPVIQKFKTHNELSLIQTLENELSEDYFLSINQTNFLKKYLDIIDKIFNEIYNELEDKYKEGELQIISENK